MRRSIFQHIRHAVNYRRGTLLHLQVTGRNLRSHERATSPTTNEFTADNLSAIPTFKTVGDLANGNRFSQVALGRIVGTTIDNMLAQRATRRVAQQKRPTGRARLDRNAHDINTENKNLGVINEGDRDMDPRDRLEL